MQQVGESPAALSRETDNGGQTMSTMHDELQCQIDAIKELHPESEKVKAWIVGHFGGIWRGAIKSFEANFDRVPTGDELLWITGEALNMDPREVVRGEGSGELTEDGQ